MGLSSHTATAVNDETVIVVGREGGVREQRRFGDVFLLRVDFERKSYFYEEAPFKIDSRSGHTAAVLSSSVTGEALMIFGGNGTGKTTITEPAAHHLQDLCRTAARLLLFIGQVPWS